MDLLVFLDFLFRKVCVGGVFSLIDCRVSFRALGKYEILNTSTTPIFVSRTLGRWGRGGGLVSGPEFRGPRVARGRARVITLCLL